MSSKEIRFPDEASDPEEVDVTRLRTELDESEAASGRAAVTEIVSKVERSLGSGQFRFAESHVKQSLDELLVMLVAVRSSDTHGQGLIDDLGEEFDTMLSPGTVYPRLHDLCDDGILDRRELVRTKEYIIEDEAETRETIARSARQHMALGLAFKAALESDAFE